MKKMFCLVMLIVLITSTAQAKIWRVNNNSGISADFTTAQVAHDGSVAGDTIHFEPSVVSYGNLTMTKSLVIIGVGDFLLDNPDNQATTIAARLDNVILNSGSGNSTIMVSMNTITINNTNGVVIQRSNIYASGNAFTVALNNASNTIIKNCFIREGIGTLTGSSTNTIILNNIIGGTININNVSSAVITNNVTAVLSSYEYRLFNTTFNNNIIVAGAVFFTNSSVANNISSGNNLPAGNGNLNNVSMSAVFIDPASFIDKNFLLKAGSPAVAAGIGGIDAGAFGGTTPYRLSVQPNIPAIYKLEAPSSVSGNTMQITISTKANN